MKTFFRYINFFAFHAINWNPILAVFVLYHTFRGEKKYGLNTFFPSELNKYGIEKGDISKATRYEAVNYYILENLLENFCKLFPQEKSLFDAGCGKGRVLVVAANYGFTHITGVDFAKELCEEAERNIKIIKTNFPNVVFKIVWNDILKTPLTADDKVFFLFNPFNKEILEKFVKNIEESLKEYPRPIYFIYASPKHADVLFGRNFKEVYRVKKMKFLEGIIVTKNN